jgi:GH24 family phage-related lysozyme (muramidase)
MLNEDFRSEAYPVPEKKKDGCSHAIGYGHNIRPDSPYMHRSITKAEARELLIKDLIEKQKTAKR